MAEIIYNQEIVSYTCNPEQVKKVYNSIKNIIYETLEKRGMEIVYYAKKGKAVYIGCKKNEEVFAMLAMVITYNKYTWDSIRLYEEEDIKFNTRLLPWALLKILTPSENINVNRYRDKSLRNVMKPEKSEEETEREKKVRTIKNGDKIKFKEPVSFYDGSKEDTFIFIKRNMFKNEKTYLYYNIKYWRHREFEKIS